MRAGLSCILLVACVTSCGGVRPAQQAEAAQAAFTAGEYAEARSLCDKGLEADTAPSDKAVSWKLERIRVEAIASSGDKDGEAVPTLTRLAGEFPAQVDAQFFAKLADEVGKTGNLVGAIGVVHAGKKLFPTLDKAFDGTIDDLERAAAKRAAEGDNSAMDALRQNGYLGG